MCLFAWAHSRVFCPRAFQRVYLSPPAPRPNLVEKYMFYTLVDGTLSTVNCQPTLQPDISGLGIRYARYLQGLLCILLAFKHGPTGPSTSTLANNLSCQAVSMILVAGVYFDTDIDVVHSLIATHFVVLFRACNFTALDIAVAEGIQSKKGRRTVCIIRVLEVLTSPVLLAYNCGLWVIIRRLQRHDNVCPQGAGYWIFWGSIYQIKVANTASNVAFAITVIEVVNCGLQLMMEIGRQCSSLRGAQWSAEQRLAAGCDPRIWWLWKLHRWKSGETVLWNWNIISKWSRRVSQGFRIVTFVYVFITTEITILANHISPGEQQYPSNWTFPQVFAICNTLTIFSLCCLHYKILAELIRTTPSICMSRTNAVCSTQYQAPHPSGNAVHTPDNPLLPAIL